MPRCRLWLSPRAPVRRFRVDTGPDEGREDAHWAAATLGVRRAGRAGRAPRVDDFEVGRALLGYDGSAPEWLVRWRTIRLHGISRDPDLAQWLVDVTEAAVGVDDVPPRDQLLRWWAGLDGTTAPDVTGGGARGREQG
jgi:hypothetical protein